LTVISDNKQTVFVVDENEELCKILVNMLEREFDVCVRSFTSGYQCLKCIKENSCDLLISSTSTSGMDGIDLLQKAKNAIPPLPVIILSDETDVTLAVRAMKLGAFEFCCKPFDRTAFLSAVDEALLLASSVVVSEMVALSPTEKIVLQFMLDGKSTKEIARIRCRSVRTIEDQHYCIMKKLGVNNMIDLIKRVAIVRIPILAENE